MAENIGKIVVSIEAEVAELRQGLAQAEAEFKKSAKRLEESQASLGAKFKKSWVEIASKISVVTTVLNVAERSMKGLSAAMAVWGEEGSSASEKVGGSILAFGDAGIPVISDVINTAEALAGMFIDVKGAVNEANIAMRNLQEVTVETNNAMRNEEVIANMERRLEIQRGLAGIASLEVSPKGNEYEIFHRKRAMQRVALEDRLQKEISQMREGAQKERAEHAARETLRAFDNESLQRLNILGLTLEKQASMEREARETRERFEKESADRIAQQKIDDAKRVADKTLSLEEQHAIMVAKQAGELEKAKILAIESRYRKMGIGATKAQQEAIDAMKAIELAGVGAGAATPTATGGGGTASISTAIGGFTVATGRTELKKQTNLLKRIANATEKLGEQGSGEVVILAA